MRIKTSVKTSMNSIKRTCIFALLMSHVTLVMATPPPLNVNREANTQAQAQIKSLLTQISKDNGGQVADKTRHANVLIFASLSLPKSSLQALLIEANTHNTPVIIRGLLPSGFKDTIKVIRDTITDRPVGAPYLGGVSIDPKRFTQFNVTRVPTFVLVSEGHCLLSEEACSPKDYDKLQGNITLSAALRQFSQRGDYGALADKERQANKQTMRTTK